MKVAQSVALVTGSNRGIGRAYVRALLAAGAAKVYAASRGGAHVEDGAIPLALDITAPASVAQAAATCRDVPLLVNNAGILTHLPFIGSPSIETAREEMETNYFGTLQMCRAFAPILRTNGGGAIVNVLSMGSWFTSAAAGGYAASKHAELSLTEGIRMELRAQGTLVVGVHPGMVDTDMTADETAPASYSKATPEEIAEKTLAGIEASEERVIPDAMSLAIRTALDSDPTAFVRELQRRWDAAVAR